MTFRAAQLQIKFGFLSSIASNTGINSDLLEQLMDNLEIAAHAKEASTISTVDVLSDVPIGLRKAAIKNIDQGVVEQIGLFKGKDPNILAQVIPKLAPLGVKKGKNVYVRGQFSSHVYILFSGRAVLLNKKGLQIKEFVAGSYFGEIEILLKIARVHTMKTMEDSHIMMIERQDFLDLLDNYCELKMDVIKTAIIREMQINQADKMVWD